MMDALASFHFLRPWWLLLFFPCAALWWLERREAGTTRELSPAHASGLHRLGQAGLPVLGLGFRLSLGHASNLRGMRHVVT